MNETTYTATQVAAAAQEALDNWDFTAYEDGEGVKRQAVLQDLVARGGFEVTVGRGFRDLWDWLGEYAESTSADIQ